MSPLGLGPPEGGAVSPLRLGPPEAGLCLLRLGLPEARLCLPSDWGFLRTGLSLPQIEGRK